jgi:uncharacterized protein DUF3606
MRRLMSDNLTNRGQRDKTRINLSEDSERRHWAKSLGATEDELKDAVHAAGDSAEKVRDYLHVKNFMKKLKDYVKQHRERQSRT